MRLSQLALVVSFSVFTQATLAEQTPAPVITSVVNAEVRAMNAQLDQLEQRLAESERLRGELSAQLEGSQAEQENAQLTRLRQDNQRLKLQLKAAQAQQPERFLGEQQQWFAVGGAVAILGFILGMLARGKRRSRREWAN
ncbi:MAG TPA: hypothetical protein PK873_09575 [Pseudomonas sp.]|uniref:hypothetical protein n=1 Tax=Pseudomonas sp. TaxID=306 RepID=UPI002CC31AB0|nr:hypothetical protein [Pseudomonas sp.]HRL93801.1 hypothetical protein [Pseudomonas sp.]